MFSNKHLSLTLSGVFIGHLTLTLQAMAVSGDSPYIKTPQLIALGYFSTLSF